MVKQYNKKAVISYSMTYTMSGNVEYKLVSNKNNCLVELFENNKLVALTSIFDIFHMMKAMDSSGLDHREITKLIENAKKEGEKSPPCKEINTNSKVTTKQERKNRMEWDKRYLE